MLDLAEAVNELASWKDGRAVVVRGAGGSFCSGADFSLAEHLDTAERGLAMQGLMRESLDSLQRLPLVSVHAAAGHAAPAGLLASTPAALQPEGVQPPPFFWWTVHPALKHSPRRPAARTPLPRCPTAAPLSRRPRRPRWRAPRGTWLAAARSCSRPRTSGCSGPAPSWPLCTRPWASRRAGAARCAWPASWAANGPFAS